METVLLISNILLWICMVTLLLGFFYLARMVGDFLNRFRISDGKLDKVTLHPGQPAPVFRVQNQHGEIVKLADFAGKHTLLLFKNATCGTCREVLSHIHRLPSVHPDLRVFLIDGTVTGSEVPADLPPGMHYIQSEEIFQSYYVDGVPQAFLLDPTGTILHIEGVKNYTHLLSLLERMHRAAS